MKSLIGPFFVLLALSSCSKDSSSSTSAQTAGGGCPTLNGTYSGTSGGNSETIVVATKVANGQYQYSFSGGGDDANYQPADGKAKRIATQSGQADMTVSCGAGAVSLAVKPDGQNQMTLKITDIGNNQVRIEDTGVTIIATKQDSGNSGASEPSGSAPAPIPAARPDPLPMPANASCPLINGEFTGTSSNGGAMDISFGTSLHGGRTTYYSFSIQNGNSTDQQPADGSWSEYHESDGGGYVALTCGASTLIVHDRENGQAEEITEITALSPTQIRFKNGGQSFVLNRK